MTGMRRIRKIIYLAVLLAVLVVPVSDVSAYTKMTTCTTQTVSNDYIKKAKGEWYTYCPVGVTDNRKTTTFYCRNGAAGQVIDYIYSTSISVQGKKRTIVALKPSEDISRFDSVHVCDPTVISDSFEYQNKDYKYAMFYLGSQSLDNQCNRIGVALSNNINNRFIKPENNIVIDYTYDSNYPDVFQWGVGQPSAISLGNGKVLLFYTRGDMNGTDTYVSLLDMADVSNIRILETTKLSTDGIGTFISNADFAYDNVNKRLYMVCDKRPFADGELSIVADTSCEYYTDIHLDMSSLSFCKWNLMKDIDPSLTGHNRNHNCGFIRNDRGYVSENPVILCTEADISLWEYKIVKIK